MLISHAVRPDIAERFRRECHEFIARRSSIEAEPPSAYARSWRAAQRSGVARRFTMKIFGLKVKAS